MLEISEYIAVLTCTIFAGAAIYINLVEHPARMRHDTKIAVMLWAPSYKRATLMQAPLAIVSFIAGMAAWLGGAGILCFVAALLIGAVVPFTFVAIMPTNRQLLEQGRDLTSAETRTLLNRWAQLHGVRSILSLAASALYVAALLKF